MLKIKEIRQKRNMSQIELSTKIEISQETISAYENGKAFPSIKTLIKIAKALNTSTDYLLGLSKFDIPSYYVYTNNEIEESIFLNIYSKLTYEEKTKVRGYMEGLLYEHKK